MSFSNYIFTITLSTLLSSAAVCAQDSGDKPPIIQEIENKSVITIYIPSGLDKILSFNKSPEYNINDSDESFVQESSKVIRTGYRVQVFDDNNVRTAKAHAQERKQMIQSRFPEFQAYVTFNSPYWRVKVGDFRTRSEAEAAMGAIRSAFPSIGAQLRVVRDRINTH